jgi:hypothetical protein
MPIRAEVERLVSLGRLPSDQATSVDEVARFSDAIDAIGRPVSREEAIALAGVFGPSEDDCFGLAWTLVHLIETAPGRAPIDALDHLASPWIKVLREREERRRDLDNSN